MPDIQIQYFQSPYGELILGSYRQQLCLCDWRYRKQREQVDERLQRILNARYVETESAVVSESKTQLEEYFNKQRTSFTIPLLFAGTAFQKEVWNALLGIPYGTTDSYLGLSIKLNNKEAIRAIAAANGANAISIIVPCHRIIGSNGSLVGYAGGLEAKRKLLLLESPENDKQLQLFS